MAHTKDNDDSRKKVIIEFDMFLRDLEPDQDEKVRGGGKSDDQEPPDHRKTERH